MVLDVSPVVNPVPVIVGRSLAFPINTLEVVTKCPEVGGKIKFALKVSIVPSSKVAFTVRTCTPV